MLIEAGLLSSPFFLFLSIIFLCLLDGLIFSADIFLEQSNLLLELADFVEVSLLRLLHNDFLGLYNSLLDNFGLGMNDTNFNVLIFLCKKGDLRRFDSALILAMRSQFDRGICAGSIIFIFHLRLS